MKRNRLWLVALLVGIMTVTTICYLSVSSQVKAEYANGRIV